MSEKNPIVIGITGTIGSGKSAVGAALERLNIPVIDSDKVVHELFEDDDDMRTAIKNRFGAGVLKTEKGQEKVDRAALGKIVFNDKEARSALEAIVHPATIAECRRRIAKFAGAEFVAVLVPLLFEANLEAQYNEIWAVYADPETLKRRLQARDNLSMADVETRLAAQLPQDEKIARADYKIDNSGSLEQTAEQVTALIEDARRRHQRSE